MPFLLPPLIREDHPDLVLGVGSTIAAILTYTTRHFINGDALTYIEMGEALRRGDLWGLANLTYSPDTQCFWERPSSS